MFIWIRDRYRRWRRQKARNVFRFFDGTRTRAVDPYAVYVALETHSKFRWDMADAIVAGKREETEIGVAAAAEVFGLKRLRVDEDGLTDGEIVEILESFARYAFHAKKKYSLLSTSLSAMDGELSNAAHFPETGNSSSGSGSGSVASNPGTPTACSAV